MIPDSVVFDASVFVRAARDDATAHAWLAMLAHRDVRASVPDFVFLEIANACAGYVRAGSMTPEEADEEVVTALRSPTEPVASALLARQALALAVARGLSVYDAAYLALALGTDAILVTADRRLADEAERSALLPEQGPPL